MMIEDREESFTLSFDYPIPMNGEWKLYSSAITVAEGWNTASCSDNWETATLGTDAHSATGTQYFRKTFTGIDNMAAYEMRFNYRYGIIAYVNGKEVFRDNMDSGAATPSTPSSGAYDSTVYHDIILPASLMSSSTPNLLAVELHFPTLNETVVDFNAFVASVASSIAGDSSNLCFVYPYPVTIDATGLSSANLFDYKRTSYYSATTLPSVITFGFTGPRPTLNGLRVFTASSYTSSPTSFQWEGSRSADAWHSVISVSGTTYEANSDKIFNGYFNNELYTTYRLTVTEGSSGSTVELYEVHPMTCNTQMPTTIQFSPSSSSYYALYDQVHIAPVLNEITGCSVSPSLPAGLSLDETTCTVSGILHSALPNTTFVMTSTMGGVTLQGSFSLEAAVCEGTLLTVTRTYSWSAFQESFSIKDKSTQEEVLAVAANSGQVSSETWSTMLCLTGSLYEVDVGSTSVYWQGTSFLYLYAILDGEEDSLRRQPGSARGPHREPEVVRRPEGIVVLQDGRAARKLAQCGNGWMGEWLLRLLLCVFQPDAAVQEDLQRGVAGGRGGLRDLAALHLRLRDLHERRGGVPQRRGRRPQPDESRSEQLQRRALPPDLAARADRGFRG